jgi:hypothetical protein
MFYTYDVFDDALRLRNMVDKFFREIPAAGKRADFPISTSMKRTTP